MANRWIQTKHCRWCQTVYSAIKPYDRDGFCTTPCKQAHYRAYKKYVTHRSTIRQHPAAPSVTPKTHKKRGDPESPVKPAKKPHKQTIHQNTKR